MSIENDVEVTPDMEETLRAGFRKFREETKEVEESPSEPAIGKAASEETEGPIGKPEKKADRPRGDKGQFVKSEEAPKEEPAVEAPIAVTAKRKPPTTWRKEAIAKWETLDPLIQEEVEKRENDAMNGINTYKSKAQLTEEWEKALAPYQATIQSLGQPPQKLAQALFAADHALRYGTPHQKAQMVQKLIKDYGIQMEGLPEPEQEDPRIAALRQELEGVRGMITQQEHERRQALAAEANAKLDELRANAPHLDAVREDMAALLETGRASSLQDAYDKAVWGKAELREALIAEQLKGKNEEAARVASEARKAASVNIPAKGKVAASAPKGSMEDDLKAGVKRLGLFT